MTADAVIAALNLPTRGRVDQRVPKKLLLESGVPTVADKRLINEGIEAIQWLAALKPATCGVAEFRDDVREYLEIAVLKMTLRDQAKESRLIQLLHRAVPYPVVLILERAASVSLSLAHKRQAIREIAKVVLDGEPITVDTEAGEHDKSRVLEALDLNRQPQSNLQALYQGWMDVLVALESSRFTGAFTLLNSDTHIQLRRQALRDLQSIDASIKSLRQGAQRTSQIARQVEINLQLKHLNQQREKALQQLQGKA